MELVVNDTRGLIESRLTYTIQRVLDYSVKGDFFKIYSVFLPQSVSFHKSMSVAINSKDTVLYFGKFILL